MIRNSAPGREAGTEEMGLPDFGALRKQQDRIGRPGDQESKALHDAQKHKDAPFDDRLDRKWTRWGTG